MFDTANTHTEHRFYAACLASYNNGVLHGAWIEASTDTDEMQDGINAMLRASRFPNVSVECPDCADCPVEAETCTTCKGKGGVPSAEEHAIHDHEGLGYLGEHDSLKTIAAFMEIIEEFDHMDAGVLSAIIADYSTSSAASEALNDGFCGIYDRFQDYADEVADEMLDSHENLPDTVRNYFDYDAFARDLQHDMHTIDVPSGVAVFHA